MKGVKKVSESLTLESSFLRDVLKVLGERKVSDRLSLVFLA